MPCQGINQHLGAVLEHIKATGHIAIQRGVTHCQFTLVARGQHQKIFLVGNRHEQHAAAACLEVFFGDIGGQTGKFVRQRRHKGFIQGLNR